MDIFYNYQPSIPNKYPTKGIKRHYRGIATVYLQNMNSHCFGDFIHTHLITNLDCLIFINPCNVLATSSKKIHSPINNFRFSFFCVVSCPQIFNENEISLFCFRSVSFSFFLFPISVCYSLPSGSSQCGRFCNVQHINQYYFNDSRCNSIGNCSV